MALYEANALGASVTTEQNYYGGWAALLSPVLNSRFMAAKQVTNQNQAKSNSQYIYVPRHV